jgi:hypothetical protein
LKAISFASSMKGTAIQNSQGTLEPFNACRDTIRKLCLSQLIGNIILMIRPLENKRQKVIPFRYNPIENSAEIHPTRLRYIRAAFSILSPDLPFSHHRLIDSR